MGLPLKGKKCCDGSNSFLYEMILIYMGGNNEIDRVASHENVAIHLKKYENTFIGRGNFLKGSFKSFFLNEVFGYRF